MREKLRLLMQQHGDSDYKLCTLLGIPQSSFTRLFNGTHRYLSVDHILEIAKHYKVSVDWLLSNDDVKEVNLMKEVEKLHKENTELKKSLDVFRKSVVNLIGDRKVKTPFFTNIINRLYPSGSCNDTFTKLYVFIIFARKIKGIKNPAIRRG